MNISYEISLLYNVPKPMVPLNTDGNGTGSELHIDEYKKIVGIIINSERLERITFKSYIPEKKLFGKPQYALGLMYQAEDITQALKLEKKIIDQSVSDQIVIKWYISE